MNQLASNPKNAKIVFLFALALLTLGLLIILELVLGYVTFKREYNAIVSSEERFIRLRENPPNTSIRIEVSEEAKRINGIVNLELDHYALETDADGFILPSAIHEQPDLKVFFLGGSTTECRILEANQRFPYLVGKLLEKKTGLKINSYNAGVSGNHSMHSLNTLNNKVLKYMPDIVVLMHNSNDILLIPYGSYWSEIPDKNLVVSASESVEIHDGPFYTFPTIRKWAKYSSETFMGESVPNTNTSYTLNSGTHITVDKSWVLRQFEGSIRSFVATCQSWNIKPILMTQVIYTGDSSFKNGELPEKFDFIMPDSPMKDSTMVSLLYSFHGLFNDLVRTIAKEENITLIDLNREVLADDHTYIYDFYHYNPKGSERVAEIISEKLFNLLNTSDTNSVDSLSAVM